MMKLTVSLQLTLDGMAQANGGNNQELDPGFTRGGWARALNDAEAAQYILESWRRPDAFLLGRKTYTFFEKYWGVRSTDGSFGEAISSKPKYLVSTTLTSPSWAPTTLLADNIAAQIRGLKSQEKGELLVVGSVSLARWLLQQELVDELNLIQFPVVLGAGERFFPDRGLDFALDLADTRVFSSGITALTYRVTGRPQYV